MADDKTTTSQESLTLSEALLAPLNSIFEAQIHASRAFLNFLFQMGFRHKYTENDVRVLNKSISDLQGKSDRSEAEEADLLELLKTQSEIREEGRDKETIKVMADRLRVLSASENLSDEERTEQGSIREQLAELRRKWPDLYQQPIKYVDQTGTEHALNIPNLALLPIRPLAINQANFKFELKVKDGIRSVSSTIRSDTHANPRRPWFLVQDPKTIEGEFAPQQKENSSEKTIKIDVTIGSVDTPYGLSKLITSLANLSDVSESSTKV